MPESESTSSDLQADTLLEQLAEYSRDIIWRMQFPADLTYISPACQRVLGWTPQEQMQRSGVVQMLTAESEINTAKVMQAALQERAADVTYEAEHLCKDGSTVWCEVHVGIQYDDDGKPVSCIGISRDITAQRKLRQRVIQSERRESVAALASAIAHNLNNDLSVILGTLELLNINANDPLINGALTAVQRASAMTRQMLTFGSNQPTHELVLDLNTIVQDQLETIRSVLTEAIELEFVPHKEPALVKCDARQIEQVLFNLVINARQALTNVENPTVVVQIKHQVIGGHGFISLSVTDNGEGMDAATQAQAFDPFYTTKASGSGLGLASIRNIAEHYGATVDLASKPGAGTTVSLQFPMADGPVDRSMNLEMSDPESLRGSETVFLVEDEEALRDVLAHALTRSGYQVHAFADAQTALGALPRLNPDLLLTDVVLPDLDGRLLAIEMRKQLDSLAVVFMSGYLEDEAALEGQLLPGPLLTKPVYNLQLLRTLKTALGR
ncbi:MAG: ATP-binding protein [Pseudomonadales bacterium]